jgi:regulator of sigma E protease
MVSILVAVLALALLIVIHEGGHFLVARLCGMRVERFSIGFGNPIVSFKKGDTVYQIAPIPLGGFVQITGLNPHEEFDHKDPYVYPNRPRWQRLAVLLAGPGANYLTACLIALGIFIGWGKLTERTKIEEVIKGSAAETVGLQPGDVLVEANGKPVSVTAPINTVVRASGGKPVELKVLRNGQPMTFNITPRKDPASGNLLIGIRPGQVRASVPVAEAAKEALVMPAVTSAHMLQGIVDMITGKQKAEVSGPVGIAREMAKAADRGALDFVQLVMFLSIYLGLFNLLPLPALDGGRALFLAISALRIKINAKTEATVHMVGLVLLLGVFVVVTFKDIKEIVVRFVQ